MAPNPFNTLMDPCVWKHLSIARIAQMQNASKNLLSLPLSLQFLHITLFCWSFSSKWKLPFCSTMMGWKIKEEKPKQFVYARVHTFFQLVLLFFVVCVCAWWCVYMHTCIYVQACIHVSSENDAIWTCWCFNNLVCKMQANKEILPGFLNLKCINIGNSGEDFKILSLPNRTQ